MTRRMTLGMTIAAALGLAACGGGGSGGGTSGAARASAGAATVAVRQLPQVGTVLVNHTGRALYSANVEAGGKIACEAACNAFWKPLSPSAGKPTAPAGAGKLGVITRPDGSKQVTVNGRPVYTFSEDAPGKATGNGFHDEFNGRRFIWSVVRAGGQPASQGSGGGGNLGGGGYSSGGGY